MPKKAKELTSIEVKRLIKPGLHAVGGVAGLLLQVTPNGARSWILRAMVGVKRRDIGLGGFPDVTLAQAREKARAAREQIQAGIDPVLHRQEARSALIREQAKAVTFEQLASGYMIRKGKEFKGTKQSQKLKTHLERYAFPYIGKMLVADIEMSNIVAMLKPIWETKTETAVRVRLNVEKILDIAIAEKKRSEINPAKWKGMLEHALPAPGKVSKTTHLKALKVDDMPAFWEKLGQVKGTGAKALQFIILTVCRSGEVRGARWDEFDFNAKTWTIPAERMKAGKTHIVPLTDDALALLETMPRLNQYVFAGARGGIISDVMVSKTPKRLGHDVTAHGFRSTFKDWARIHTAYPDEVSELALAHVNDDKTRAAYARDGLIVKRRQLMTEWVQFCKEGAVSAPADNVVSIGGAA